MTIYYYTVSLFDKQTSIWRTDDRFQIYNILDKCLRGQNAIATMLVYMRNDIEDNREYYESLHNDNIACKWSVFSIEVDSNGNGIAESRRYIYSCATEDFVESKRVLRLENVFDVD